MNMNQGNKPPTRHQVNWEDPSLKSLLNKTEGWSLDNRGVFAPVACELHVGWGAGSGKSATLVFEANGVMVIEANFMIPPGENVRVDHMQAGTQRSNWGIVAEGRAGRRGEDSANGTQVYWIHMR